MKKQLLTLIAITLTTFALAQKKNEKITVPIDSADHSVSYAEVVKVTGASKEDLYIRSKEWFAKTFNSTTDVIQMDNQEAGKIIGKSSTAGSYNVLMTGFRYDLNYTISVTVKDERYKYEISQFFIENLSDNLSNGRRVPVEGYVKVYNKGKGSGSRVAKQIIAQLDNKAKSLLLSFNEFMKQSANGGSKKDDF